MDVTVVSLSSDSKERNWMYAGEILPEDGLVVFGKFVELWIKCQEFYDEAVLHWGRWRQPPGFPSDADKTAVCSLDFFTILVISNAIRDRAYELDTLRSL